jgi:hypothetical protein
MTEVASPLAVKGTFHSVARLLAGGAPYPGVIWN